MLLGARWGESLIYSIGDWFLVLDAAWLCVVSIVWLSSSSILGWICERRTLPSGERSFARHPHQDLEHRDRSRSTHTSSWTDPCLTQLRRIAWVRLQSLQAAIVSLSTLIDPVCPYQLF